MISTLNSVLQGLGSLDRKHDHLSSLDKKHCSTLCLFTQVYNFGASNILLPAGVALCWANTLSTGSGNTPVSLNHAAETELNWQVGSLSIFL